MTTKEKLQLIKEELKDKLILIMHGFVIENEKKYSPLNQKSDKVYCFKDYNEFLDYFHDNGINLEQYKDKIDISHVTLFTSKTGKVYAVKYLCDYTIELLKNISLNKVDNYRKK